MQIDQNYDYIISAYIAAAVILSALAVRICLLYKKQSKINNDAGRDETKA
jgi:hypothetical protein